MRENNLFAWHRLQKLSTRLTESGPKYPANNITREVIYATTLSSNGKRRHRCYPTPVIKVKNILNRQIPLQLLYLH